MEFVKLVQLELDPRGKLCRFDVTAREFDVLGDLYRHVKMDTEHLASLRCDIESNRRRLRRTVLALDQRGYIHRQTQGIGEPNIITLSQRGVRALAELRGLPERTANAPRGTVRNPHDLALANFTVSYDLNLREIPTAQFIDEAIIYARCPVREVRSKHAWPVMIHHRGHEKELWVEPDRLCGVAFSDRPIGRNSRYHAVEEDTGSMPLEASSLDVASIERKLLAYEQTHKLRLLDRYFGIPFCYPTFLTKSPARRDNIVALAGRVVRDRSALDAMLFSVQPDKPTIGKFTDPASMTWLNGRGKGVNFPL